MKKIAAMLVLASVLLFAAQPAAAAEEFLTLKVPGVIGTSTVTNHVGEIVILSFSLGVTAPKNKRGAAESCSDLAVMKLVDQTSPSLFLATAFGVDFREPVVLTYSKADGGASVDVYSITLSNVSISSVQESGASGGGLPTESVSLHMTSWTASFTGPGGAVTSTVNCLR